VLRALFTSGEARGFNVTDDVMYFMRLDTRLAPRPRLTAPSKLALSTLRRCNAQVAQTLQGFHKRHAIAPAGPVVATLKVLRFSELECFKV